MIHHLTPPGATLTAIVFSTQFEPRLNAASPGRYLLFPCLLSFERTNEAFARAGAADRAEGVSRAASLRSGRAVCLPFYVPRHPKHAASTRPSSTGASMPRRTKANCI